MSEVTLYGGGDEPDTETSIWLRGVVSAVISGTPSSASAALRFGWRV